MLIRHAVSAVFAVGFDRLTLFGMSILREGLGMTAETAETARLVGVDVAKRRTGALSETKVYHLRPQQSLARGDRRMRHLLPTATAFLGDPRPA